MYITLTVFITSLPKQLLCQQSPDDNLWWRLDTDGIISLSDDLVLHPEEVMWLHVHVCG